MTREQMDRRARLFAATCPFHGLNSDRDLALHVRYVAEEIERLTERDKGYEETRIGEVLDRHHGPTRAGKAQPISSASPRSVAPRSVSRFLGRYR